MQVLTVYRGRSSVKELAELPNRYLHTLYYKSYKTSLEKSKEDQANSKRAQNEAFEDEIMDAM